MFTILFLFSLAFAQFTCPTGNSETFNQCVINSQVSPTGGIGARNPTDACASIQTQQAEYYACLCDRSTSILHCYTSFCPGESNMASASQFQFQYCQAAGSNPVTSPTISNQPATGGTLPKGGGTITVSSKSSVTAPSSSAFVTSVWSNIMIFGEFFVMLILANVV